MYATVVNRTIATTPSNRVVQDTGTIQCQLCHDVLYKGVWYASDSLLAQHIDENQERVYRGVCRACRMQRQGLYEGIISITHIPTESQSEVWSVVMNVATQVCLDNPQYRVVACIPASGGYTLHTTSATMVRRIGKKLTSTFTACHIETEYISDPHPQCIVTIRFQGDELPL